MNAEMQQPSGLAAESQPVQSFLPTAQPSFPRQMQHYPHSTKLHYLGQNQQIPSSYQHDQQPHIDRGELYENAAFHSNETKECQLNHGSPKDGFILKAVAINRLGITTIVIGTIFVIAGICEVAVFGIYGNNRAGVGIWGGVMIILAGVVSIVSSKKPMNKAFNAFNMIMSSSAIIFGVLVLVLTAQDLGYYDICVVADGQQIPNTNPIKICESKAKKNGGIAFYTLLVILACAQLTISIIVVYISCYAYASCRQCSWMENCLVDYPTYQAQPTIMLQKGQAGISDDQLYILTPVTMTTNQQSVDKQEG